MTESLRSLLYPLGFVASFFFTARFFLQWIQSERRHKSHVTPLFWALSLIGNLLMGLQGLIQLQLPILLFQAVAGAIAWRNLDLLRPHPRSLRQTLLIFCGVIFLSLSLYRLQGPFVWMRSSLETPPVWHLFGLLGMTLFASRFWIQWWLAEKRRTSFLAPSFWWMSLSGAFVSILYFIHLKDPVQILGYSMGAIPYIRNLMLLQKKHAPKNALFLFAGEQSGDSLGSELVETLSKRHTLYGVGGPKMRSAGLRCFIPMERFEVMGFSDVLLAIPRLLSLFCKIKREILRSKPPVVILIDYPEFTMLLARSLRKKGYTGKIVHYVCPSIWAWRKGRKNALEKHLDLLLAILPFEKELFHGSPLQVAYVGHPLASNFHAAEKKEKFLALFPGSRRGEIALNLPLQLEVASSLGLPIAISVARPELKQMIASIAAPFNTTFFDDAKELMRNAKAALATSGTITLELALHEIPTVVTYKIAPFNFLLGRYLFRIFLPNYCLVNIICGRTVFPEYFHKDLNSKEIRKSLEECLARADVVTAGCKQMRSLLETDAGSLSAPEAIEALLP